MHLLPQGDDIIGQVRRGFEAVQRGELAERPTIEWYIHTTVDPSLQDEHGRHNGAFFVQWVPYELTGTTWEREESRYVERMLDVVEEFAPNVRECIVDAVPLTPAKIESHFGIRYGHIHHIDNTFAFDQRVPYAWPVDGLYSCSAGTHPAGSVIGAAGHNAAQQVLRDLGRA
jgi:phytoene dehydrogenase-like protein